MSLLIVLLWDFDDSGKCNFHRRKLQLCLCTKISEKMMSVKSYIQTCYWFCLDWPDIGGSIWPCATLVNWFCSMTFCKTPVSAQTVQKQEEETCKSLKALYWLELDWRDTNCSILPHTILLYWVCLMTFYKAPVYTPNSSNKLPNNTFNLTLTALVTTIDAQWEGMGDVGSARYEPALLPPHPTIRILSYSN